MLKHPVKWNLFLYLHIFYYAYANTYCIKWWNSSNVHLSQNMWLFYFSEDIPEIYQCILNIYFTDDSIMNTGIYIYIYMLMLNIFKFCICISHFKYSLNSYFQMTSSIPQHESFRCLILPNVIFSGFGMVKILYCGNLKHIFELAAHSVL